MSKKQLLTESEMRRFMRLANIPALGKEVVSEMQQAVNQIPQDTRRPETAMSEEAADPMLPAGDQAAAEPMGDEGGEEGGEVDADMLEKVQKVLDAVGEALGIKLKGEVEGGEEMDMGDMEDAGGEEESEEEGGEEEDEGDEEEMQEVKHEEDEGMMKEKWGEEQQEESQKLSEDELVEAVLSRVTARLVAEAAKKKAKKGEEDKKGVKAKMKAKKAGNDREVLEKKKEDMKEATEAKGGGPLLSKGGNKHDTYKGHADMEMGKGEKGGKGGHEMETVSAKSEHTVTHGGTNLATKGGNKTK